MNNWWSPTSQRQLVLHDRTESKDRTQRGLRSHAFLLKQALDQSYLRGGPLKGYPDTNQRPLKRQKVELPAQVESYTDETDDAAW